MRILRKIFGRRDKRVSPSRKRCRLGVECLEDRRLLASTPFEAHFDFGTAKSPEAAGYTRVTESTRYSAGRGFGWQAGSVASRDRGVGSDVERDFNFTRDGTFAVDLPDGPYRAKVVFGDLGRYAHDNVGIFFEGDLLDTVTTAAYQVAQRTYDVDVADGQLTMRIADRGGRDGNAVIEALEVVPSVPALSIGDVQQTEGDTGSRDFVFPVTLSFASSNVVSVQFATVAGSAAAGEDYTSATGTLVIPAGNVSGEIRISVRGDTNVEPDQDFFVNLNNVVGATLLHAQGKGTILTDETPPELSISIVPTSVSESDGPNAAMATVTRSGASAAALTVALNSSDTSEATTPANFVIPAGKTSEQFAISAVDDAVSDGTQTVSITASAAGYASDSATLDVTDNDRVPYEAHFDFGTSSSPLEGGYTRVSRATRYSAVQGYGWAAGAVYSADRGARSALIRDFNYTRNATFAADVPDGRYRVDLNLGDLGRYAHDLVAIYLENNLVDTVSTAAYQVVGRSYQVEVADGQLTMQIADRGGRDGNGVIESLSIAEIGPVVPVLSVGDVRRSEGDSGTSSFVFPATLSAATDREVTVQYSTSNHSAIGGSDYAPTSGTLRIPAGATSGSISVTVTGDGTIEPDESFFVNLSNVTAATLDRSRAVGMILNDDLAPSLRVSLTPDSVSEAGGVNAASGTVRRTGSTASAVVVSLSSNDATEATAPTSVEIRAGADSAQFAITAVDDTERDGPQNVKFSATAVGYIAGEATLEVTDDDAPDYEAFFDFGTGSSPLENNYTRVSNGMRYTASRGFGWSAGTIGAADRGVGSNSTRDFNYTRSGTFSVDVANGRYQLDATLGDMGRYAHDLVGVYVEGAHVDTVSTAAYQIVSRRYTTEVVDGQLTLRISDLGGRDGNGVIESLVVTSTGPVVPDLSIGDAQKDEGDSGYADLVFSVNLSTATSVAVTADYSTRNGGARSVVDYTPTSGSVIIPAGRTSATIRVPIVGDQTIETDEVFYVDLSNIVGATAIDVLGTGTINNDDFPPALSVSIVPASVSETAGANAATGTVTRTGSTGAPITIGLSSNDTTEATVPASVQIPAGAAKTTFPVAAHDDSVSDGTQTVTIAAWATGYSGSQTVLDVTDDDQPPYEGFFDFGTTSSPLSPGFTRVSNATQYAAAQGYGWLSGVVGGVDRGGNGLVERDGSYTRDATFVVDIPRGRYGIDVLLGDAGSYAHDLMGVFLEGAQVASVSTAGRQVVNRHFDVEVTDGQLTLRLQDLGGGDANVVIEGLRILAAGTGDPVSNAWWPAREGIPNALFSARTRSGVYDYYLVETAYQRTGNNIRVLLPDDYNPLQEYPVIYVLPVEKGNGRQFGDGMTSIYNHGLHRTTDAIFVQPTFSDTPWFVDHVSNSTIWQETYVRDVIVPFIEEQYSVIDGPDGRLLLGYSKSGYGAVSMLLRNQDYFGRAVAWDSPLAMSDPGSGWDFLKVLGSRNHFRDNYQITNLLQTEGLSLIGQPPRIFLQGYSYSFTRADHAAVDALMTNLGIPHTYDPGVYRSHVWASGWLPGAVDALMAGI